MPNCAVCQGYVAVGRNCSHCGSSQMENIATKNFREERLIGSVLSGAGWAPPVGRYCAVTVNSSQVTLSWDGGQAVVSIENLKEIEINGHSSTSSAGIFGGGFGLQGAAEGMLVAGLINKMTTKTKTWVIAKITGLAGNVELFIPNSNALTANTFFRPALDAIATNSAVGKTPSDEGIVAQLERLAALVEKGLLTTEEFQAAKTKLL